MANIYEAMNVRQKLAKARLYFLNQKVQKSGKNMHLEEGQTVLPAQNYLALYRVHMGRDKC